MEAILLTDGYKLGHRNQYPEGTNLVYSNWTARSNKYYPEAKEGVVVFGITYLVKKYLIEDFNKNFFDLSKEYAIQRFRRRINNFLGENNVGTDHIEALHDLGYLPIRIKALPEGSLCPIGIPCLTLENTKDEFFWLTNYLETLISTTLWLPMTSATTARLFKKNLYNHASTVGIIINESLDFMCHDFSMRGMGGIESSILSGMGHLTSFVGSETIPAIEAIEDYYNMNSDNELIAGTIPATEHSVMSAGGDENEFDTFKRLLTEVYPNGFLSIVSDTWNFWDVLTKHIPNLKKEIMNRNGRFVVRPDSGDPVDIICGLDMDEEDRIALPFEEQNIYGPQIKGAYEILWDIFGGTINEKGFKVLDPHIGIIYGDSITLERQKEIYKRLEKKGFAASNLVLGIGSYTYQYKSRDFLGFAMKATYCEVNGESRVIYKDPVTDTDKTKKSLKGLLYVGYNCEGLYVVDNVSRDIEKDSRLDTIFEDGTHYLQDSFTDIRRKVDSTLSWITD